MRPTLRIVDDANIGAIAGTVDASLIGEGCLPKVYIFNGADRLPDDIEEAIVTPDEDPVVVAGVAVQNGAIAYPYRAAFLAPGAYTVSFTCGDDDPVADQMLGFIAPTNVTVVANLISTVNFTAPAGP